jgi:hypothetical protein
MSFHPAKDNGRFLEQWAAQEHAYRVLHLVAKRGMTFKAATIVVDAAMLGEGCTEGIVRARIQVEQERQ